MMTRRWSRFAPLLMLLAGCRGAGEYSDSVVPRWYRENPWGPKATADRAAGILPNLPPNPDMIAWEEFARLHLRDGDILFREADARLFFNTFPFSKIAADMSASRFTHTGIFTWENGEPIVYDTSMGGARRMRLGVWSLDNVGHLGISRPRPEYQAHVPAAVDYCRSVYLRQLPFDMKLGLGDDEYYCAELTARSYAYAGLPLATPIRICDLPRYEKHQGLFFLASCLTSLHPEQPMYFPGDVGLGLWASPYLESVYEAPRGERPDWNRVVR